MTSLSKYLKLTKKWLEQPIRHIVFVIGNESADLDSMVSSVGYAYLRHLQQQKSAQKDSASFIPLISVPKADFVLRGECVCAFDRFLCDHASDLTFTDQVDLGPDKNFKFFLVDHNKLPLHLTHLDDRVQGILDHHIDENMYPNVSPRIIETIGSTASLVALEWMQSEFADDMEEELASLLLSAVLVDTVQLQPEYERATPKDHQAAEYLLSRFKTKKEGAFMKCLFDDLLLSKSQVSHLNSYDLLRKDFKCWLVDGLNLGISSINWGFKDWLERDKDKDWYKPIRDFAKERNLDVCMIMTGFDKDSEFYRELFVNVPSFDKINTEEFTQALLASDLQLEPMILTKDYGVYSQKNLKASRKQVQPIVAQILLQCRTASSRI